MSEKIGLVTYDSPAHPTLGTVPLPGERNYSEETARDIDKEVDRLMEETYHRTREILKRNRSLLDTLADHLLEGEVLEGEVLKQLLGRVV